MASPTATHARRHWHRITPDRLVFGLLLLEGLLLLSERFQWFAFNQHIGWTVLIAVAGVAAAFVLMLLWLLASLLLRRRFQFGIRSLLVLAVAVAIACSWLTVEVQQSRKRWKSMEAIRAIRGSVGYYYGLDWPGNARAGVEPPPWLRRLLGDDFFTTGLEVHLGSRAPDRDLEHFKGATQLGGLDAGFDAANLHVTDARLKHLKGLTRVQYLDLRNNPVTDAGLEHLKGLSQLRELHLGGTQVSDAGLEHVKGMTQLQQLNLGNTQVADAGLERLKGLTQLQYLDLGGTQVTDAGLEHLKGLAQLRWLNFGGTQVTDEGVKKLQQTLPSCKIIHYHARKTTATPNSKPR